MNNEKDDMTSIKVAGQCYKQKSSQCIQGIAELCVNGDIVIKAEYSNEDAVIVTANINDVKISNKLGNTPREILFPLGEFFSFQANNEIESWLAEQGSNSRIGNIEKSKAAILSALFFVPVIIFLLFTRVIPFIAIEFSQIVPESLIELSSRHTLMSLDKTLLSPSEIEQSEQEAYIEAWQSDLQRLVTNTDKYKILLRSSESFGANAFALPDGTIVITDDLVELLADYPQSIIAILLHEIGHVERHHSMRNIAQTLAATMVINYLLGDVSGLIDLFFGTGATIITNQFSQKLEWEADDYAIEKLTNNGGSAKSFAQAMELILDEADETQLDKLFSTHPLLRERAEHARAGEN